MPTFSDPEEPKKLLKRSHNKLKVEYNLNSNDDLTFMDERKAKELNILNGDNVLLTGKVSRQLLVTVVLKPNLETDFVYISKETASNLKVNAGDYVKVEQTTAPFAQKFHILPFEDCIEGLSGDLFTNYIRPYFKGKFKPVTEGSRITIRTSMIPVEFKVIAVDPSPYAIVVDKTDIHIDGDPVKRNEDEIIDVGYADIGGCRNAIRQLREMIELPLKHPQIFRTLGIKPPRGVLLHGPPGCGKSLIARAVTNETGCFLFLINGPDIVSNQQGGTESNLRSAFEEAEKNAPSIIFIDEIDAIAPKRDSTKDNNNQRVVAQLLTLMDGLKPRKTVIVIGATNRPNALDQALRRFGRFDVEIDIGVPDSTGREEILKIHTKNIKIADDVDLSALSHQTHGFVGADLAQLCTEAAMHTIRSRVDFIDLDADEVDVNVLNELQVTNEDFKAALKTVNPSSIKETVIEVPDVTWDDIGGLIDVKRDLREMVQYPILFPEKFEHFGMNPSKGVLLYGPPGCGKTLLAKAVANECEANFISIKGPELLTMWYGESEANVRDVFAKARLAAPCVLFFDELDSIGSSRGHDTTGVSDRVINQLLTEMDGIGVKKDVFIIGATNRPDILDPALLRPGRLDQLLFIPMPDFDSRLSILNACLSNTPLSEDINFEYLARQTDKYSGADISEICQTAVKLAIRESIEYDYNLKRKMQKEGKGDEFVPSDISSAKLMPRHFASALSQARRSVSDADLARYSNFAQEMNIQRSMMSEVAKEDLLTKNSENSQNNGQNVSNYMDEDIYH